MTELSGVRKLLRACQIARDVAFVAGPAEASRQFAFELSTADAATRQDGLSLLATLAARGDLTLPEPGKVERVWNEIASLRLPSRRPRHRGRGRASSSTERLPVEAARVVPIDQVAERLGLRLHRRGRRVVARCPFHDDRHPSLLLDVAKGLWHCFPCGIGGDGIALLMRVKGICFTDAVRELAA